MSDDQSKSAHSMQEERAIPGGYHSRGVPGEEAAARKRMTIPARTSVRGTQGMRGGAEADSLSAEQLEAARGSFQSATGERVVYALIRHDRDSAGSAVVHPDEQGNEDALALFTDRNLAVLYLQVARLEEPHEVAALSPPELGEWLVEAKAQGINLVAINPARRPQLHRKPQPVLVLSDQPDFDGEHLYREVVSLADERG